MDEMSAGDAADASEPSGARTIEVLIVDDHRVFGDAMCIAVNLQPDMTCRGAVTTAEEAIALVAERCADVALLDVSLPGMDGITAIGALRECCPTVRTILLTADTRAETLLAAVEAGADGFLPKGFPFTRVLQAVRHVEHELVAEPLSLNRAIREVTGGQQRRIRPGDDGAGGLTEREFEILVLLAEGLPVKQVAKRLDVSVNTCRGHVAALLRKLEVHSQLAAVVKAARLGMLPNLRGDPQL
ncbi:MAG TPA: response regulator transcription factor [Acidimicrobiales bacterium]|nr:response regulator transcription factor [Acidimicrobiales bacterium]